MSKAACAAAAGAAAAMSSAKSLCDSAEHDVFCKEADRIFDDSVAREVEALSLTYVKQVEQLFQE